MSGWEFSACVVRPPEPTDRDGVTASFLTESPFVAVVADPPVVGDRLLTTPVVRWAIGARSKPVQQASLRETVGDLLVDLGTQADVRLDGVLQPLRTIATDSFAACESGGRLDFVHRGDVRGAVVRQSEKGNVFDLIGPGPGESTSLAERSIGLLLTTAAAIDPAASPIDAALTRNATAGEVVRLMANQIPSVDDPQLVFAAVRSDVQSSELRQASQTTQTSRTDDRGRLSIGENDDPPTFAAL